MIQGLGHGDLDACRAERLQLNACMRLIAIIRNDPTYM